MASDIIQSLESLMSNKIFGLSASGLDMLFEKEAAHASVRRDWGKGLQLSRIVFHGKGKVDMIA